MEKKRVALDDIPKKALFSVPEGYFDELPQRVQTRVAKPSPAFTISWNWQRTLASLASVGLVAVLVFQSMPRKQGALGTEMLTTVENAAIVDYLHNQNLTPFDLEDQAGSMAVVKPGTVVGVQQLNVSDNDILEHLETQNLDDVL